MVRFERAAWLLAMALATTAAASMVAAPPSQGGGLSQVPASGGVPPSQTQRAFNAALSGVVVDALTDAPLSGALLAISASASGATRGPTRTLTDEKGRFAFPELSSGAYSLQASRTGYINLSPAFGGNVSGPTSPSVTLVDGEWRRDVRIRMWRPGSISGTVLDESGAPVVGVFVRALASIRVAGATHLAVTGSAQTDDRGMYELGGLTPGRYLVSVPSVQSSVGASATTDTITNASPSRIPGPPGSPAPVAPIARALDAESGGRLTLGNYAVPPPPANGQSFAYPIGFHGGGTAAQATSIVLGYGDRRTGVDVRLEPVTAHRVSGRIDGPLDNISQVPVRLLAAGLDDLGNGSEAATAQIASDGTFTFVNVPSGSYVLDVPTTVNEYTMGMSMFQDPRLPSPPASRIGGSFNSNSVSSATPGTQFLSMSAAAERPQGGRQPLVVGSRDETDVVFRLAAPATIAGQVALTPTQSAAADAAAIPSTIVVNAEPAAGEPWLGRPNTRLTSPGAFTIPGLLKGKYFLRVTTFPSGWMVMSVMAEGRDYTHAPIDMSSAQNLDNVVITLSNATNPLAGSVRGADGLAADGALIVVFPVEEVQWSNYGMSPTRIGTTRTSNTGAYKFGSLPAGDYFAIAVADEQATLWLEPQFFPAASRVASRVRIQSGQSATLDLRVVDLSLVNR